MADLGSTGSTPVLDPCILGILVSFYPTPGGSSPLGIAGFLGENLQPNGAGKGAFWIAQRYL